MRPYGRNAVVRCERCGEDDSNKLGIIHFGKKDSGRFMCFECGTEEYYENKGKRRDGRVQSKGA